MLRNCHSVPSLAQTIVSSVVENETLRLGRRILSAALRYEMEGCLLGRSFERLDERLAWMDGLQEHTSKALRMPMVADFVENRLVTTVNHSRNQNFFFPKKERSARLQSKLIPS